MDTISEQPDVIPRKVLFGNPERQSVRLSPDGAWLSYLAPVDGVMNIWVAPRSDTTAAHPVTTLAGRGVRMYVWAFDCRHMLYFQDTKGDENWRLISLDIETQETLELTPFDKVVLSQQHRASLRNPNSRQGIRISSPAIDPKQCVAVRVHSDDFSRKHIFRKDDVPLHPVSFNIGNIVLHAPIRPHSGRQPGNKVDVHKPAIEAIVLLDERQLP